MSKEPIGVIGLSLTAGPLRKALVGDDMFIISVRGCDINLFIDPETAQQWRAVLDNRAKDK